MSDLFDMLSGQGRGRRGPAKSEDTAQKLSISLKDFYLGTTKCVPACPCRLPLPWRGRHFWHPFHSAGLAGSGAEYLMYHTPLPPRWCLPSRRYRAFWVAVLPTLSAVGPSSLVQTLCRTRV